MRNELTDGEDVPDHMLTTINGEYGSIYAHQHSATWAVHYLVKFSENGLKGISSRQVRGRSEVDGNNR